jgi:hypothetical protein
VTEEVREVWLWESGNDKGVRTDPGPETAYWRGTEFSRMGGYDLTANDGSEGHGSMGPGFIVLGNSVSTGSIRVDRTEEGTNSTRETMEILLEVLSGVNVTENLVVIVDN